MEGGKKKSMKVKSSSPTLPSHDGWLLLKVLSLSMKKISTVILMNKHRDRPISGLVPLEEELCNLK